MIINGIEITQARCSDLDKPLNFACKILLSPLYYKKRGYAYDHKRKH